MSKYIVDIHGEIEGDYEIVRKYEEQEPILDKIRAEIRILPNANPSYWHSGDMVEREEVLNIIDKYRVESEDEE